MEIMLDTANLEQIKASFDWGFIDGVTTNPTILSKEISGTELCTVKKDAKDLFSHLDKLRALLGDNRSLHVQVTAPDFRTMVEEGKIISARLGKANTYIKVPATVDGVKAMKALHDLGIKVTATAVNSLMQGLLASYAGADYVAIYYSNMAAVGSDAMGIAQTLNSRFATDLTHSKMLAASFKTPQDVADCYAMGAECATVTYDMYTACLSCPITTPSLEKFSGNWNRVFGAPYTELVKGI